MGLKYFSCNCYKSDPCCFFRCKRLFVSQDLETLLEERGVSTTDLMPQKNFDMRVDLTKADTKTKRLYPPFLSLDTFDDTEYDCRRPDDWLKLGVVNDLMVHRNLFPERLYCLSLEKTLPIQTSLNGWMLGYFGMIHPLNCTLSKLSGWVESSTI